MELYKVNGKDIYVVEDHHSVLEAWEIYKPQHCNVITFDYHTDTQRAFNRTTFKEVGNRADSLGRVDHVQWQIQIDSYLNRYISGDISCQECISKLKNDEFIDFATRTKIINIAFVVSYDNTSASSGNNNIFDGKVYHGEKILEFTDYRNNIPEECTNYEEKSFALDNRVIAAAEKFIESYFPQFFDNYILDVDLDYINTLSVFEKDLSLFKNLIKNAKAITIAREPRFIQSCMQSLIESDEEGIAPEHNIPLSDKILLEKLLEIIMES